MNVKDYAKKLEESQLTFEGNNITKQCKLFLSGLLEKNITRRISFEQAVNHPWIVQIKDKVNEITANYHSDPEKMIHELNKCIVTDEYFEQKDNYVNLVHFQASPINVSKIKSNEAAAANKNTPNANLVSDCNLNSQFENTINMINGNLGSRGVNGNLTDAAAVNNIVKINNFKNACFNPLLIDNINSISNCDNNKDYGSADTGLLNRGNLNSYDSNSINNNNRSSNTNIINGVNNNNNINLNASQLNTNLTLNSDLQTAFRNSSKIDIAEKDQNRYNNISFNNPLISMMNNHNNNAYNFGVSSPVIPISNNNLTPFANYASSSSSALINSNVIPPKNIHIISGCMAENNDHTNQAAAASNNNNNNSNIFLQNIYLGKTQKTIISPNPNSPMFINNNTAASSVINHNQSLSLNANNNFSQQNLTQQQNSFQNFIYGQE